MSRFINLTQIVREEEGEDDVVNAVTKPMTINVEQIREFYPRKDNKPGTRISMIGGAGLLVNDEYEAVKAAVIGN